MISVTVLGSGSRGNAILVDGTEGSVLVDAGFGPRSLARRLALADRRPEQIDAVLLTHEHTDHAGGVAASGKRWGWPVYGVPDTLTALQSLAGGLPPETRSLQFDTTTAVSGFHVQCVRVPHDAAACAALILTDTSSGTRVGVALDLGHVQPSLTAALAHCDLLVVESNHDERMLADGPYPWALKQRVSGKLGHLSNTAAAMLVASVSHRALCGVILAHLSETNNAPAIAVARTRDALRRSGWNRNCVWAAAQSVPLGPVGADGVVNRDRSSQLVLGL